MPSVVLFLVPLTLLALGTGLFVDAAALAVGSVAALGDPVAPTTFWDSAGVSLATAAVGAVVGAPVGLAFVLLLVAGHAGARPLRKEDTVTTAGIPHRPLSHLAGATPSAGTGGARVEFRGIVKGHGQGPVLRGVDLDIAPGEFVSLLGPPGCGKTTALRVLAGLDSPDAGEVLVGGQDVSAIPPNKRDIGMVFSSCSLFPHLRVAENAAFGLRRRGSRKADAASRAADALELVGLGHLARRFPHQLSGGEQQTVALARALITEPRVLLLDEPLSALDAATRGHLRDEIRRIQLELGITTVLVTSDQEEAFAVSDRIAVMIAGRVEQIGTPEDLYLRPSCPEVAAFVGISSLVPAIVSGTTAEVWGQDLPLQGEAPDGHVEVFLRPENVRLVGMGEPGVDAVIEETTFLGSFRRTTARTADGSLVRMQHAASERVEGDQRVRLAAAIVPVLARTLV